MFHRFDLFVLRNTQSVVNAVKVPLLENACKKGILAGKYPLRMNKFLHSLTEYSKIYAIFSNSAILCPKPKNGT